MNIDRECLNTWLDLLDEILVDVPPDGHRNQRDSIVRLRADMLDVRRRLIEPDSVLGRRLAKPVRLPPIEPIKKPQRPLQGAGTVECPRCGAPAGDPCFKLDHPGAGGKPTKKRLASGNYHEQRRAILRKPTTVQQAEQREAMGMAS